MLVITRGYILEQRSQCFPGIPFRLFAELSSWDQLRLVQWMHTFPTEEIKAGVHHLFSPSKWEKKQETCGKIVIDIVMLYDFIVIPNGKPRKIGVKCLWSFHSLRTGFHTISWNGKSSTQWGMFQHFQGVYPLVMTNSLPWKDPPIFNR